MKDFEKQYDIKTLSDIIKYNHERYIAFQNNLPFEKNTEYEKVLSARYQKVSRIKRRLLFLLSHYKYVWFCTFTFSDKYINKCDRTKRDLIKSVLNTHDFKYILNIDYGKRTEREHYHCVLATDIDMDVNQYFQSFYPCHCLAILCKSGLTDFKRLSKYINKLTNHCIKATTKRQRLVYNFKGFDVHPDSRTRSIIYDFTYEKLFEDVSLLDKADITGKMEEVI